MTPERFKDMRIVMGFSQKQLAEKLEMTAPTICHLEGGSRPIKKTLELAMRFLLEERIEDIKERIHKVVR